VPKEVSVAVTGVGVSDTTQVRLHSRSVLLLHRSRHKQLWLFTWKTMLNVTLPCLAK